MRRALVVSGAARAHRAECRICQSEADSVDARREGFARIGVCMNVDERLASELTLYVDGNLPDDRRAALEARIATDPELAAAVREQRALVTRLQALGTEVGAPGPLRARVRALQKPARRRAFAGPAGWAAAAAAVILAVVLALPSGSGGPSLAQAAQLGRLPAAAPAPPPASKTLLRAEQDGVPFPRWRGEFGWRATGKRTGEVGGRNATTVYYENPKTGKKAAYTIVAGDGLAVPKDVAARRIKGTTFSVVPVDGRRIVTWERKGHTCVLQGTAPTPRLLELASWRGEGSIPF